jgi:tetraacyldisaccharide 4'-kinase
MSEPVVSDGKAIFLSPEESGDEPFLMAKNCPGIPVLIGKNRFANGRIAIQRFNVQGLILDDGYQHIALHRNINILLVDCQTAFGDGALLPRGILREPLSQLRRADLFLLTKVENPQATQESEKIIRQNHPSSEVFHSHYDPVCLINPEDKQEDLHSLKGRKVLALSGIASPDYFSSLLKKCGAKIISQFNFPDHHVYSPEDLVSIKGKGEGADYIVTTEKDMVKLKKSDLLQLPIRALRVEMKIWEEKEFYQRIIRVFKNPVSPITKS